jgi:cytochrome c553
MPQDALRGVGLRWRATSWALAAVAVVVAFLLGFVVLGAPATGQRIGVWAAICRGLGLRPDRAAAGELQPAPVVPSFIAWTPATLAAIATGRSEAGAFVALNCAVCHGEQGVSKLADVPTLAGMDASALYKELADYRSGKRLYGAMNGIALALSLQNLADVSVYYARLPGGLPVVTGRDPFGAGRRLGASDPVQRLVYSGDPSRGIGACGGCHGPIGYRRGAPALASQDGAYLERQTAAFAQGSRHNDINEQMRTVAVALTGAESAAVSQYYASLPAQPK